MEGRQAPGPDVDRTPLGRAPRRRRRGRGKRHAWRPVRCLIVTPTRELASQVEESVVTYGRNLPLTSTVIFGGVGMQPQVDALRRGVDIVVATLAGSSITPVAAPSISLQSRSSSSTKPTGCWTWVSSTTSGRILKLLPEPRQNLLFSATIDKTVRDLAGTFLDRPEFVQARARAARRDRRPVALPHTAACEAGGADRARPSRRLVAGARLHPDQAPREPNRTEARTRRDRGGRDPRQQEPGSSYPGPIGVQGPSDPRTGRDRHRRARPRHRWPASRRQLRDSERARGLRPPDRSYGPSGQSRSRDLAGRCRGGKAPPCDRESDRIEDPRGNTRRLRSGEDALRPRPGDADAKLDTSQGGLHPRSQRRRAPQPKTAPKPSQGSSHADSGKRNSTQSLTPTTATTPRRPIPGWSRE